MRGGARRILAAFIASAAMVTSAWAGASLLPAGGGGSALHATPHSATAAPAKQAPQPGDVFGTVAADAPATSGPIDPASLPEGQVLAGAAKTSIEPQPAKYGGTWERDPKKCATLSEGEFENVINAP